MTAVHPPFDLLAPLPDGQLAIEASAGTGKTYTLAALATRFLAETDLRPSELLIVTFTRAATTELRARVRARVAGAADFLAHGGEDADGDAVLQHLAAQDRALRAARLEKALTDFDNATIATIHGFATQVLGSLGTAAGPDTDLTLVADDRDLADEVCADVLAAAAVSGHRVELLPPFTKLATAVQVALGTPDLLLTPEPGDEGETEALALFRELVEQAKAQVRLHHRRAGTRSFADVLVDLRSALQGERSGGAIAGLRGRYRVVLIDEFQDTDPVQWDIFSSLFSPQVDAGSTLVLVGDPKQAIYAFRGANVHTYLDAVAADPTIRSLGTNHRSDGAAIDALDALFRGATFGSRSIGFAPVEAAAGHVDRRVTHRDGRSRPALAVRTVGQTAIGKPPAKPGTFVVGDVERVLYLDLVAQVRDLLDDGLVPDEHGGEPRTVRPSDVAVLVRSAKEAEDIQAALQRQGVPAVLQRGNSVLVSPAAEQWRWLLEALGRPSDPNRARTFALSWFGGRSAAEVATATDAEIAEVQDRLRSWSDTLSSRGVGDLVRRLWAETGVVGRVLARPDGDRALTDLDHVAELFRTSGTTRSSVPSLLAVLDTEPEDETDTETDGDAASRRVESEAEAVQIMTIWVAKGLEFPITCCPTLWRAPRNGVPVTYQDEDRQVRAFDLADGKEWPDAAGAQERTALAAAERAGEQLRLLYVALTRARHQTILWWANCRSGDTTALAHVLFARDDAGALDLAAFDDPHAVVPAAADLADRLGALAQRAAPGHISVTELPTPILPTRVPRWVDVAEPIDPAPLLAATFDRPLDRSWRRWSFSSISDRSTTVHPHDVDTPDEPEDDPADDVATTDPADRAGAEAEHDESDPVDGQLTDDADDEDDDLAAAGAGAGARRVVPPGAISPLAALPAGPAFGTLSHAVLEHVDFTDPDLPAALRRILDDEQRWRRLDLTPLGTTDDRHEHGTDLLVEGLDVAIHTSLGPLADGLRLRDIDRHHRLDELEFALSLGDAGHHASERDIGRLLLEHLEPDDPFRGWAAELAEGAFDVELAGHLTGFVDLTLRVPSPSGDRFVIVDYKTNRLHDRGAPPRPGDYAPAAVAREMAHHHYPLQALLYLVALHRYLRWRLPAYDPATNLGGAAYLFLRGMSGPDVAVHEGVPHGVCSWPVPPAAVVALSDLLHGHAPSGGPS